jgi:EAL domain-containing protein (putative c-di-GMP-specific phosphodiesterase class I)
MRFLRKSLGATQMHPEQPIVSLRDSRIVGFEALVRWQRPDFGLVLPVSFLPAAEETGLILPIGNWVLQEACRQVQAWNQQFPSDRPFTVAVNISAKQFAQSTLVGEVERTLKQTGLAPSTLKLELTETVAMRDPERTPRILGELEALGVRFSMDDFGTAYSSFRYLRDFPLDTLKIDRCFISEMGSRGEDREIVRTIITLGHNLGMELIAEGVQTINEARVLEALGCEYAQGYFFSKPIDSNQVRRILMTSKESSYRPSLPLDAVRKLSAAQGGKT